MYLWSINYKALRLLLCDGIVVDVVAAVDAEDACDTTVFNFVGASNTDTIKR